jgi:serine/threonine-protein kinase
MGESALQFGRYEALFRIASGGMAEVFAGRVRGEGGFEKLVAIKRMLPHLADDPEFVSMFLDEARVAANVSSPHVVQTLDIGRTEDGALFIVMDLVVGLSLSELRAVSRQREEPLPKEIAVAILAQAAEGLHDAHEARTASGDALHLVHRDVSPQNLLVGADGRTRLTDFGIAFAAKSRMTETEHGKIKGKFAYFSPEQSHGAALDRRSDVFALGIVGWEMLAGCRLFAREKPSETIEAVRNGPIPRLDEIRPELEPELASVIDRALARDVEKRYPTARAMAEALRGIHPAQNGRVESFVESLRPERLVQLEARIREAVASPEVRTLPDIDVEVSAIEEPDITQLPTAGAKIGVNGTPRSKPSTAEAPTKILAGKTEVFPHRERRPTRSLRRTLGAVVAVTLLAAGSVVVASTLFGDEEVESPADVREEAPVSETPPPADLVRPAPAEPIPPVTDEPVLEEEGSVPVAASPASPMRRSGMRRNRPSTTTMTNDRPSEAPMMSSMQPVGTGEAAGLDLFDTASMSR